MYTHIYRPTQSPAIPDVSLQVGQPAVLLLCIGAADVEGLLVGQNAEHGLLVVGASVFRRTTRRGIRNREGNKYKILLVISHYTAYTVRGYNLRDHNGMKREGSVVDQLLVRGDSRLLLLVLNAHGGQRVARRVLRRTHVPDRIQE